MSQSLLPDALSDNTDYMVAWCLRALLDLNLLARMGGRLGTSLDDELVDFLGLQGVDEETGYKALRQALRQRQKTLGAAGPEGSPLWHSIQQIAPALRLNAVEQEVLLLVIAVKNYNVLDELFTAFGSLDVPRAARILSVLLQQSLQAVQDALAPASRLLSCGILQIERRTRTLDQLFELIDGFEHQLLRGGGTAEAILKPYMGVATPARLQRRDFKHVETSYKQLRSYLRGVLQQRASGANVLLYGPPGTGKTELTKTLAAELGCTLFEIGIFLPSGDAMDPADRLRSYRCAQHMLDQREKTLLLFDEIEDAFPAGYFMMPARSAGKAWVNRMLEGNPVPTFWLSNAIEQLDDAMIRRFDLVIELDAPNAGTRRRLLNEAVDGLDVSSHWVSDIARNENLAPAHLERAARVARLSGTRGSRAEAAMSAQIEASQKALGGASLADYCSETPYDPAFANVDQDLERIIAALAKSGEGRLCLYGPPGTGKTGLAYHLGHKLGRPVLAKPASQLLSMYVGQTEKEIAAAFTEARQKKAILLLDEADSLIHDRSGHQRSWETTQVNELLMQLERFRGIVIASTNLLEKIDSAAMRRFDFKIRFGYLRPEQAEAMFRQTLRQQGWRRAVPDELTAQLQRIRPLSPACFAVAIRQARIYGEALTPQSLLDSLRQEAAMLQGPQVRRPIGFAP